MFKCLKEIKSEEPIVVTEAEPQDNKKVLKLVLIIAGGVLVAAGIAFLVYKLIQHFSEKDFGDYDDFDEDEDFFEGEENS